MSRICLLTPGHLSTNPRLIKEADALAAAGHRVSIIAADYSLWARAADRSFDGRPWRVVRTLPFGPYAPRLKRAVQLLRYHSAKLLTGRGIMSETLVNTAWHAIAPDLIWAAASVPADLYIAHYPAALPAAAIAARRNRGLYAFDAEDFHLGDLPDDAAFEAERRLLRAIESRYLPECVYTTAASPGIADAYVKAYRIPRPTVVLNVFPRAEGPARPTPAGTVNPGPSVYWFSQTIGPDRGLECAVRAIGRARTRPHLYLRGTPAKGFLDRLHAAAAEVGAADRLHLLPSEAPGEMALLAATYDVGFVGETGHTANRRIALTNKQFTYFLAGVPAVMSDIPSHRAFASEAGGAVRLYAVGDSDRLAAALDALLGNTEMLAGARAAAFDLAQTRFNWDRESDILLNLVEKANRRPTDDIRLDVPGISGARSKEL